MKWNLLFLGILLLSGCVRTGTYHKPLDSSYVQDQTKALIVGTIHERFITQPHNLIVKIDSVGQNIDEHIRLTTYMKESSDDEYPGNNAQGHYFMYELSPGRYEISGWKYFHYRGEGIEREEPIQFEVESGEVIYIGDISGESLGMCLSNKDNYDDSVAKLKSKFTILESQRVLNKSAQISFFGWPHSQSTDVFGKGICYKKK